MTDDAGHSRFLARLHQITTDLTDHRRGLALYAAAIALTDQEAQELLLTKRFQFGATRDEFCEIVLQSYLFLGFPRMLLAAEQLAAAIPTPPLAPQLEPVTAEESRRWFDDGQRLCRQVYGASYEPLRERVQTLAPEIFRWMIIEGYGKVLSRPGLDPLTRELAIVATLVVENHAPQLLSHIRGAINVGADPELLMSVVSDLGREIGPGFGTAMRMLQQLERN